ncbi:MAG: ribonuclease PH [Alphaproteobacteria bacterium]|nr:ribonuclease PH [Alphaproteobacteria bacterium]
MPRLLGRASDAMRPVSFTVDVSKHAEGSCLVKFGDTHVLCTASVEEQVPSFLRGSKRGWVTAEYGMLPRATTTRTDREAAAGKQSGRTQEIQRLVGRALRAVTRLDGFGERAVKVDCDVLQADGGTRTASISGGYVALYLAFEHLKAIGVVKEIPLRTAVAAVSCGIVKGVPCLDLDYDEDSKAEVDANFVVTGDGKLVEVQGAAEGAPFERAQLDRMLDLALKGCAELVLAQRAALKLA